MAPHPCYSCGGSATSSDLLKPDDNPQLFRFSMLIDVQSCIKSLIGMVVWAAAPHTILGCCISRCPKQGPPSSRSAFVCLFPTVADDRQTPESNSPNYLKSRSHLLLLCGLGSHSIPRRSGSSSGPTTSCRSRRMATSQPSTSSPTSCTLLGQRPGSGLARSPLPFGPSVLRAFSDALPLLASARHGFDAHSFGGGVPMAPCVSVPLGSLSFVHLVCRLGRYVMALECAQSLLPYTMHFSRCIVAPECVQAQSCIFGHAGCESRRELHSANHACDVARQIGMWPRAITVVLRPSGSIYLAPACHGPSGEVARADHLGLDLPRAAL